MANFNAILNHILGIVFIIIVFSLAYAYLKPHQLHKRRLVSTLLLKVQLSSLPARFTYNNISFSYLLTEALKKYFSAWSFLPS